MNTTDGVRRDRRPRWYNAVWRWHFYAGLFTMPFVLWLSLTGSLYLWRPQIEGWLERPYDHLAIVGALAAPDAQVAAALHAVPGSTLHKYIIPEGPGEAVRILVSDHGEDMRVTLDPRSLVVLKVEMEERRPFRLLFHLHGELLAGAIGSYLVEIAACWTVVMLLTGLYLWWPRGARGLAGVLYPRLRAGSRVLWRDIHAIAGVWVSLFALGLILTGLPWAKGWGSYLGEIRRLTGTAHGPVDWSIGGKPPKQAPMVGEHASHGMAMGSVPVRPGELARVIAAIASLEIAPPIIISPPRRQELTWSVASDAADRPLRSDLRVDGATGLILSHVAFAQRHWIDKAIGIGVAAHEGALFGLANQLAGTATALLLAVLSVAGAVLWWRRRPAGSLGAPPARSRPQTGLVLAGAILVLGVTMPMFGATLVLTLLTECLLLRRLSSTGRWLGLIEPAPRSA